jgi:putative membrane protein
MHSFISYWNLDAIMILFMMLICLGYLYLTDFKFIKRSVFFIAGFVLIIISVASPLYFLGENYLMSAHMLSHVLLLLIAAPLLVLGIPEKNNNPFLVRVSEKLSAIPWLPWMAGVCIMWFWHIPAVFNRLLEWPAMDFTHPFSVHILSDLHLISLILCGIIFCWPVIGPFREQRLLPLHAVLYLSAACIFCSILGLLITFAPMGIYTPYMHIEDHFGFLNMIRNEEGISAIVDQQAGGLIMWVPGCLIYLSASIYILMKWFNEKNHSTSLIIHNKKP